MITKVKDGELFPREEIQGQALFTVSIKIEFISQIVPGGTCSPCLCRKNGGHPGKI